MNRKEFIARIESHGWDVLPVFDPRDPQLVIEGNINGIFFAVSRSMPIFHLRDHEPVLHKLYELIARCVQENQFSGRA